MGISVRRKWSINGQGSFFVSVPSVAPGSLRGDYILIRKHYREPCLRQMP